MPGSRRYGSQNLHQVHSAMHPHINRARPVIRQPPHAITGAAKAIRAKRKRNRARQ